VRGEIWSLQALIGVVSQSGWIRQGSSGPAQYVATSLACTVLIAVIEDAEADGLLLPHTGSVLFEGTVGSTGISLATVGRAK
jgi:hypothetical protein